MSMSSFVIGIRPPDDDWKKMKAIWDACEAADIEAPDEVQKFFKHETPDEKGVLINLEEVDDCVTEYSDSDKGHRGFEISVEDIPEGVKILRFYNSW